MRFIQSAMLMSLPFAAAAVAQNLPLNCPASSLSGQPPELSAGDAGISDSATTYIRYDNFAGLAEPICGLRWWGYNIYNDGSGWELCSENPMPFVVTFYEDDAGMPGAEVCSHTATIEGSVVHNIDGWDLYLYEATLDSCCDLQEGWVSVVGGGESTCWFMWRSSAVGDDSDCFDDGQGIQCSSGEHYFDLSMCLLGEPEPIPAVSSWGLMILTLLLLAAATVVLLRRRAVRC